MTTSLVELLASPLPADWTIDGLAERLLSRVATGTGDDPPVDGAALPDRQSQRLIRPLLACLAKLSADEGGAAFDPYGGTLEFVRAGPTGAVRITGEFVNRADAVRLALTRYSSAGAKNTHAPALVSVLAPGVVAYRIADSGFSLAADLDRLDRARAGGADEAVVLYCTRIVEAMARRVIGGTNPELAWLLQQLVKYKHLPTTLKRLLDVLRNLGNDARHALQPVSAADADFAFVALLRWLQWVFCEAAFGPRLPAFTLPNQPADALLPVEFARLVDDSAATGNAVLAALSGGNPADGATLFTPALLGAAAEALLARSRTEDARTVIDHGLRRFQRDRRLRQLLGLYWSRRGQNEGNVEHLHRARRELEPLLPRSGGGATDEETFGILGGVYKRLSDLVPDEREKWLRQARDTYRAGWDQSGRTNDYLGINAATAALWLGSGEVAEVAQTIRDVLAEVADRLRTTSGDHPLTYWDQVTWAEAELLLGEWARAGELYRTAFERHPTRAADIAVAVGQARRVLEQLRQSARAGEILGSWVAS